MKTSVTTNPQIRFITTDSIQALAQIGHQVSLS